MGYRYGEHKYSEGLYSRWPDWWHDKACQKEDWEKLACGAGIWSGVPAGPVSPWKTAPGASSGWSRFPAPVPYQNPSSVKFKAAGT